MKKKEVFQSTLMSAKDFAVGEVADYKISKVSLNSYEENGVKTSKPCMSFEHEEQGMSLNVTNWDFIEDALGKDDSDDWIGAWVRVEVQTTKYKKDTVNCFRITAAAFAANAPGGAEKPTADRSKTRPARSAASAGTDPSGSPF